MLGFRLYYSANKTGAALAAPPTIARVDATSTGGVVTFKVHVVGDPAAGIQGVWVTYLALNSGKWQSLDLTQDTTDTTLWTGTLTTAAPIQFMVQAVDGVGLVTLDTNAGVYYQPNQIAPALQTAGAQPATALGLGSFATSAPYGSSPTLSATLTSAGSPVASKAVTFTIGNSIRTGITNASGTATVQLPLINLPGELHGGGLVRRRRDPRRDVGVRAVHDHRALDLALARSGGAARSSTAPTRASRRRSPRAVPHSRSGRSSSC